MPRLARLDAPHAVHHVMARGIDRTDIFRTETDRIGFAERLGHLTSDTGVRVLAWALLSNHFHLLLRSAAQPVSRFMQRLLSGYALVFNHTHGRCGHLFQNRFKSVLVEDEAYLSTVMRYIHLNPLRAGIVTNAAAMARYPWSGHAGMLGISPQPWHATAEALATFGSDPSAARCAYQRFVSDGAPTPPAEPTSAGWVDRDGAWRLTDPLLRGREAWVRAERVLGSAPFLQVAHARLPAPRPRTTPCRDGDVSSRSIKDAAALFGLTAAELRGAGQRRAVAQARAVIAAVLVREVGLSLSEVAVQLGTSRWSVRRALDRYRRGELEADERLNAVVTCLAACRAG